MWCIGFEPVLPDASNPRPALDYMDIGSAGMRSLTAGTTRLCPGIALPGARRVSILRDTLLSTLRSTLKAVGSTNGPAESSIASEGLSVLTHVQGVPSRFVGNSCQGDCFGDRGLSESVGITYLAIGTARLKALEVSVPPIPEQAAIAPDPHVRRCTQEAQRQIGLFNEYRTGPLTDVANWKLDVLEETGELWDVEILGADSAEVDSSGDAVAHRVGMGAPPEPAEAWDERRAGQCRCL